MNPSAPLRVSCKFNKWTQHDTIVFCFYFLFLFGVDLPAVSERKMILQCYWSGHRVRPEADKFRLKKKYSSDEKIQWPASNLFLTPGHLKSSRSSMMLHN